MTLDTGPVRLGYSVGVQHIQPELWPLLDEVVASYKVHHADLKSVYVIGSVALGEWKPGISDLDVIGVTASFNEHDDNRRRRDLVIMGDCSSLISYVDSNAVSESDLRSATPGSPIGGHGCKLALSGVCIWGDPIDATPYLPTVEGLAVSRTERVRLLMIKYRSGNLIEPFRRDERLLVRSCAKAAMRALSGATLLRGSPFHSSPYRTAEEVRTRVPEGSSLADQAIAVIDGAPVSVAQVMTLADQSVDLFHELFPGL